MLVAGAGPLFGVRWAGASDGWSLGAGVLAAGAAVRSGPLVAVRWTGGWCGVLCGAGAFVAASCARLFGVGVLALGVGTLSAVR
ncbi:hypothetical protein [Streptomyces sp. Je 1-369]|uniref:hypothetical protein n=1 Tax=Streptomyces sp. Je 1-369 TaxID=2966192 RepID=UPI0022865741|nr:hypothetical protein [Streptomyces sp. Je 1-369]WAL98429.1 hypothetical protein NOO62_30455 [Streptomyces sp. Je 1-369]